MFTSFDRISGVYICMHKQAHFQFNFGFNLGTGELRAFVSAFSRLVFIHLDMLGVGAAAAEVTEPVVTYGLCRACVRRLPGSAALSPSCPALATN